MSKIIISKNDEVNLIVKCEAGQSYELQEEFTFYIKNHRFHPKVRFGAWDGKLSLYNLMTKRIYGGLFSRIMEWAERCNYDVDLQFPIEQTNVTTDELNRYIKTNAILFPDGDITTRDYQLDGVLHALNAKKCILLSATSSGKSLMIFLILNWFKTYQPGFKFLLVVPTIGLVYQMINDFKSYGDMKFTTHTIAEGSDKYVDADVTVSTWQSIQDEEPEFFRKFTGVIGDEAHTFQSKKLIYIMSNLINASVRIGTTGTLDDHIGTMLTLQGLFGPVHKVITAVEMMDQGYSAKLNIKVVVLNYPEEQRKALRTGTRAYAEEIHFLQNYEPRNKLIIDLVKTLKGNTLVMFNGISHGKHLANELGKATNRKVFLIYGAVDGKIREEIRQKVEFEDDAIVVASYKTFQLGVNIKRLHNVVFAHPSASKIRVLQSIGRGLRKGHDKTDIKLIDIADNLTHKKFVNHTFNHFKLRVEYYNREKFEYTIHAYNIK